MKTHPVPSAFTLKTLTLFMVLTLINISAYAASPTPPDKMTYQGYLVDANGVALAPNLPANYPVIFRIYDASQGGTLLWSEQQIVTVDKGNFSVVLGEGTQYQSETRNALSGVFNGTGASDRYLGISVTIGSTTSEIAPRLRLLPAPYAFLASTANALVGADGSPLVTTASGGTLNAGGNINATGNISANGTLSAPTLNVTGTATAATLNVTGTATAATLNVIGTATATNFVGNGIIPIGGIILWSGSVASIPAGWGLCDGGMHDGRQTPNLRDRFVIGAGNSYAVNATGGSTTKALVWANMPAHAHNYNDYYFAQDSRQWSYWLNGSGSSYTGYLGDTTRTTTSAGNGTAFDIMPPYYALAYIMRTK